jgi:hypothetical protein
VWESIIGAIQPILGRTMAILTRLALTLALAALALAPAIRWLQPEAADARPAAAAPRFAVIVLENHEFDEVIGSAEAPFLNRLARRGTLVSRYHAVDHPSLSNYLAMIGGSTFGIRETCTDCRAGGDNLAAQLTRAGISWRAYMEDMPRPCFEGATHDEYAKRHNPFMYFETISSVPSRCRNVVPATRLDEDLRANELPTFSWLSPDLCHNAHDCAIAVADHWLSRLIPRITRKLGPGGILVVTFDEGKSDSGCCGGSTGGRVATIFAGPGARRGARLAGPFDHYALLATIEDRFGLPRLRMARGAPTLRAAIAAG